MSKLGQILESLRSLSQRSKKAALLIGAFGAEKNTVVSKLQTSNHGLRCKLKIMLHQVQPVRDCPEDGHLPSPRPS